MKEIMVDEDVARRSCKVSVPLF